MTVIVSWPALVEDTLDVIVRRLVKFYTLFGFRVVKEVNGGLLDFLDMMVWGGVGTLMDAEIASVLKKWTDHMRAIPLK